MNRRTLKKLCKRAVPILIAKHRYKPEDFTPADGDESIYAPPGMEKQFVRHGFIELGPLKGTPLLWVKTSYEYDEWDATLPSEMLRDIEFWATWEPTPEDIAEWNDHAAAANVALASSVSRPPGNSEAK